MQRGEAHLHAPRLLDTRIPQALAGSVQHLLIPLWGKEGHRGFEKSYIFRAMRAASSMASQAVRALTQSPIR